MPKQSRLLPDIVEVFDFEQGSDEWFEIRRGIPTASNFGAIMAKGTDDASKTRSKLMRQMAGEILSGIPMETFTNAKMERGKEMEARAREHYAFARGVEVVQVGFVRRTIRDSLFGDLVIGCSPDGLVGDDRVLEIKTMQPDLLVELIDSGRFPKEHVPQCQGNLWGSGRKFCDLRISYDGMPKLTFEIKRDDVYIKELENEVRKFVHELNKLVERIRAKAGH